MSFNFVLTVFVDKILSFKQQRINNNRQIYLHYPFESLDSVFAKGKQICTAASSYSVKFLHIFFFKAYRNVMFSIVVRLIKIVNITQKRPILDSWIRNNRRDQE